jgi:hypothetical protein
MILDRESIRRSTISAQRIAQEAPSVPTYRCCPEAQPFCAPHHDARPLEPGELEMPPQELADSRLMSLGQTSSTPRSVNYHASKPDRL